VNATTTNQVKDASKTTLPASSTPAERNVYGPPGTEPTKLSDKTIGPGGEAHNNIQPSLAISFIISLFGIYPSRN
jgi:microcystin-dependent protein